ncbi:hypothetical protein PHYBOEH_011138 [Phytophthora boehmeriae]|uniref:EF-hand domain-containing protein n=1 Tax=Phytophthora boehmeriae TaxID=109152 RepID=A0A8T1WYB2_9STRA|nr:hypothetical protein PHYBOEH_011138 [Phytophthora boehmeriae]
MVDDARIERTYQALVGVVQTTAVTRKVLARPPFTFLHKLLVETLGDYDLFSDEQLQFSALNTKQAKAAFLTRAISFVTFVMSASSDHQHISCLLLVSPVQVLAGIRVADTLEFLEQLCEVCQMPNRDIKDAAAKEVRQKGDSQLYASGVTFRKGIVLIQGVIRKFLKRRVRKAPTQAIRLSTHGRELSMNEGTRFLKELADGRVYNGIIRGVQGQTYVLGYEEDAEAEDKVDEIEMKIILEESQRLSAVRENHHRHSRNASITRVDEDISLADLPDLTPTGGANRQPSGFLKRMSSPDPTAALLETKTYSTSMLKRAQSQNPSKTGLGVLVPGLRQPTKRNSFAVSDEIAPATLSDNQKERSELRRRVSRNGGWQSSFKKILAEGRDQSPLISVGPEADHDITSRTQDSPQQPLTDMNDRSILAQIPSLPKQGIPGTKPLGPITRRSSNASTPTGESRSMVNQQNNASQGQTNPPANTPATRIAPLQRSNSSLPIRQAAPVTTAAPPSEGLMDIAFAGTYQTTDQRTQERLALIRDIVLRIDMYMKRKRLRVIDLFRFCDADGNGSISPGEMIETLSQMEIQLTPDQARDFLDHIDKDGNGSIDVDEFEELVRVARRNEAQREQVKKELSNSRKQSSESKPSGKTNTIVKAKTKQRILDEFNAAQEEDGAGVNAIQLRSIIAVLALPGLNEVFINDLVDRAVEIATSSSSSGTLSPDPIPPSSKPRSPNGKSIIHHHHLVKALDELEWSKKSNRFLDQSWIRQFDSQLERAIREYELL